MTEWQLTKVSREIIGTVDAESREDAYKLFLKWFAVQMIQCSTWNPASGARKDLEQEIIPVDIKKQIFFSKIDSGELEITEVSS